MQLDIEYRLYDLKKAIQKSKSQDELIERVEKLEKLVMGA